MMRRGLPRRAAPAETLVVAGALWALDEHTSSMTAALLRGAQGCMSGSRRTTSGEASAGIAAATGVSHLTSSHSLEPPR